MPADYAAIKLVGDGQPSLLVVGPYADVAARLEQAGRAGRGSYIPIEVEAVTNWQRPAAAMKPVYDLPHGRVETERQTINLANVVTVQPAQTRQAPTQPRRATPPA